MLILEHCTLSLHKPWPLSNSSSTFCRQRSKSIQENPYSKIHSHKAVETKGTGFNVYAAVILTPSSLLISYWKRSVWTAAFVPHLITPALPNSCVNFPIYHWLDAHGQEHLKPTQCCSTVPESRLHTGGRSHRTTFPIRASFRTQDWKKQREK